MNESDFQAPLPCPYPNCDAPSSAQVCWINGGAHRGKYQVHCFGCEAQGPPMEGKETARLEWDSVARAVRRSIIASEESK